MPYAFETSTVALRVCDFLKGRKEGNECHIQLHRIELQTFPHHPRHTQITHSTLHRCQYQHRSLEPPSASPLRTGSVMVELQGRSFGCLRGGLLQRRTLRLSMRLLMALPFLLVSALYQEGEQGRSLRTTLRSERQVPAVSKVKLETNAWPHRRKRWQSHLCLHSFHFSL